MKNGFLTRAAMLIKPSAAARSKKELLKYLRRSFEKVMLTGQQESVWRGSTEYEMDFIKDVTGKLPAIRGLDFIAGDFKGVVERSKKWWEAGGIVTVCWHTGINGGGYRDSKYDVPDFNLLFDENSPEHKAMIKNWDMAAEALYELKDAGVPVMWRPFHEFDGGWFWWGKGGGENFVRLWRMMYDRFTLKFKLDNLIWVLGYADYVREGWYPGNRYCDVIGSDTYKFPTHKHAFDKLKKMKTGKPIAFHECGDVPPVDEFLEDGCLWSWFMVWHSDFIKNQNPETLKAVYNHERAVTFDKLPKWRRYK